MDKKELETRIEQLKQENKQLKNRCWAITNGLICQFCDFEEDCLHSKPKNDKPNQKVRDRSNIYNQGR